MEAEPAQHPARHALDNAFVWTNVLAMTNASGAAVEAFADPLRRRLVEGLATRPQSVTELAANLPVSRSAVSQHLAVLAGAGLVGYETKGRQHLYHVEPDALLGLRAYLDRLWDSALASAAALATADDRRPADGEWDDGRPDEAREEAR